MIHREREQDRRHNDIGFQKIESFFFDIFGCGGACDIDIDIAAPTRSANANAIANTIAHAPDRYYALLRPIDSIQLQKHEHEHEHEYEYYRNRHQSRNTNKNANGYGFGAHGGRSKKSRHRKENDQS
jgi:hypothetical protein